ncbi:MAG: hypothetical protein MJY70_03380 [Bacteroidales bacterium]|nr:hypothetical protein [Bacteroidales bacterium]
MLAPPLTLIFSSFGVKVNEVTMWLPLIENLITEHRFRKSKSEPLPTAIIGNAPSPKEPSAYC